MQKLSSRLSWDPNYVDPDASAPQRPQADQRLRRTGNGWTATCVHPTIAEVLEHLPFGHSASLGRSGSTHRLIQIDRHVRDYLLHAIKLRCGDKMI